MLSVTLGLSILLGAAVATAPPAKESSIRLEFHGKLRTSVSAIGGETTGTTVDFDGITVDLKIDKDADRKFAAENHKEPVSVTGTVRQVKGPARGIRWVVDVEKITARAAGQEDGATVTIVGTLQKQENETIVIEAGDASWPLDVSEDKSLKEKAEALIGTAVTLSGRSVKLADDKFTIRPLIRVDTLAPVADKTAKK